MNSTILTRLLEENVPALVLYARQWTDPFAEDVVQEAFLRLLRENPPPSSPKAWLYRVVRNLAIDHSRHDNRTTSLAGHDWFENADDSTETTELLQKLSDDVREIVVSKIWGDLTFREIAELTGRPISSVHYDYQQGIAQLKEFLQ